jgi:hypothetical protein
MLGDFNPDYHSHHATNAALQHAARALARTVETNRSMDGMLAGIQFARARNRPFVAT